MSNNNIKYHAIAVIPAAGSANRMGFDKITSKLCGIPLLVRTIISISSVDCISSIIIAAAPNKINLIKKIIDEYNLNKVTKIIEGGNTRVNSVWNAIQAIEIPPDVVAIHDGARPFVSSNVIEASINAAIKFGGAIVANKVIPTIKKVNSDNFITNTIDRNELWAAATPQSFRYNDLISAYNFFFSASSNSTDNNKIANITDDAQIFELSDKPVKIIESNSENIKLTNPLDWKIAEFLITNNYKSK